MFTKNVSLDAGALCSSCHFGNYVFTVNLIEALKRYDRTNHYDLYSFCHAPKEIKVGKNQVYRFLTPKRAWMKGRVTFEEIKNTNDVFLAVNQSMPLYTRARIIAFSHGLSFKYFPKLYPDSAKNMTKQVKEIIKRAHYIVVSSEKVKKEFISLYGEIKKIKIIHFGLPLDFPVNAIKSSRQKFFLFVGMNHPIKNIDLMIFMFNKFIQNKQFSAYKLYLVGNFYAYKSLSPKIQIYSAISRDKLRILYQNATAYLSTSLYESFNLPVLEALSQGCPVVGMRSAIIPEFSSFTHIANNEDGFMDQMIKVATGDYVTVNLRKLASEFSWLTYIEKLNELF